jgi:hypothetical protein
VELAPWEIVAGLAENDVITGTFWTVMITPWVTVAPAAFVTVRV